MKLTQVRNSILAVAALAVLAVAVSVLNGGTAYAYQVIPNHPAATIGSQVVVLTHDQVPPEDPSVIRAFVPTGSASSNCLVTNAESNLAQAGTTVFCGRRVVNGVDGVMITVFFPQETPPDLVFIITLYQERAQFYGAPALYLGQ